MFAGIARLFPFNRVTVDNFSGVRNGGNGANRCKEGKNDESFHLVINIVAGVRNFKW